jgi:hypothetical protein
MARLRIKSLEKRWVPWRRYEFAAYTLSFDNSEQFAKAVRKQMREIQTEPKNQEAVLPTFRNIGTTGLSASCIVGLGANDDESHILRAGPAKKQTTTLSVATGSTADPTYSYLTDATESDSIFTDAEMLA